ncbi:AAA family ATPase [Nodosilinea nodulosa]|uniref:AAA family ATPase n=1 Tax=Nodosilinea nodulosa TaxID=416001 RepID=UPI00031D250D|nr:AAA family ATPase [Nodosilinea nodulosa]
MSITNAALQGAVPADNQPVEQPAIRPGDFPGRSAENQAEVERIGKINTYVSLSRDEALFEQLNTWRDLKLCARILTIDRLGIQRALEYYVRTQVKRRGSILQIPASIVLVEIEQNGSSTDLMLLILEFLSNPLDCGNLRDLRARVWGTLKAYGVKLLIVNNADLLSFKAFTELMRIFEKLNIPVVLAGMPYLDDMLDIQRLRNKKFVNIHNTFLKRCSFDTFSVSDTSKVIKNWERSGLRWSNPMKLDEDTAIVDYLHKASQGQLRPLYENLREIAVWKLDNPKAEINPQNVAQALGVGYQPVSNLSQKD